MSKYDEETGLVLSDEDEIAHEADLDDDDARASKASDGLGAKSAAQGDKSTQAASDLASVQKVPRINKRALLMVCASLVSLIVIVSLLAHPDSKKKKAQDTSTASELSAPDFSVSQKPYDETSNTDKNSPPPATPVVVEKPVYEAPSRADLRSEPSSGGGKAEVIGEKEGGYTVSSIIPDVQGRLFGQEGQAAAQGGAQGNNPMGRSVSALGAIAPQAVSQDAYTASRLANLGGSVSSPSVGGNIGSLAGSTLGTEASGYQAQNMQGDKQSFYATGRNDNTSGGFIGADTIWNGTTIPGVLKTGINTDIPGDIKALVTENVYDSQTGRDLLIPQGSILIASYNSSVSFAQSRVQIAWNTLIRPDGYQVSLGNMSGVDSQGYAGTKGQVDEHLFQYVKAAGIISAFTIVNGEFANQIASTQNQEAQNLLAANQNVVNQLGTKLIDRAMDVQPTLTVKNGEKINIMVNKNIRFPPMNAPPVQAVYTR